MAGHFDNTIDDRWRPGTVSSWCQMRDDEAEAREETEVRGDDPNTDEATQVIQSRELSFVPSRRPTFEAHDAQTRALIARFKRVELLPHGAELIPRLADWQWLDQMSGPAEKQAYLEPIIEAVRRDPVANKVELEFLLIVFEPIRRSVSKQFVDIQSGLVPRAKDVTWANRHEAQLIRHVEREALWDVTRNGVLEAIFRYPAHKHPRLFPWLREAVAHHALNKLRHDLAEPETSNLVGVQARAVSDALHGLSSVDGPEMRDAPGYPAWRADIDMRSVFAVVNDYFEEGAVSGVCRAAIGRLPRVQGEVITALFLDETKTDALARERGVSRSTVYNHKAQAQRNMHDDDVFFAALVQLGRVRDSARRAELDRRYPDGQLPDGRRLVHIDQAA